jgi:hypothetical protein
MSDGVRRLGVHRLDGEVDMSGWLILLTGAIYAYVAGEQWAQGNNGMAIAYAGYAFSNWGLYLLAT